MIIFLNEHVFHLNESLPNLETNSISPRQKPLVWTERAAEPEPVQSIPGSRGRAAGRTASAASEDSTPGAAARRPGAGLGGGRDQTGAPREPAAAAAAPGRGRPFPRQPRPGAAVPMGRGRGGERRERSEGIPPPHAHNPAQGRRRPGAPPGLGSRRSGSRARPDLPCTPAPGHSPRSERTGCRPPWSRRPAGGGRGGAGSRPRPPPRPRPGRPAPCPEPAGAGDRAAPARLRRRPPLPGRPGALSRRLDSRPEGPRRSAGPGGGGAWKPVSLQKRGVRATAPGTGPHPGAPCPGGSSRHWICSLQNATRNRSQDKEQKSMELLDFVLVG